MSFGRRFLIPGRIPVVLAGSAASVYFLDEKYWYRVVQRSARAVGVGIYTAYNYKVLWTPENSSEIHKKVALALTNCCLENEGLYVKIGQAICSMAAVLPPEYVESLSRLSDKAKTYDYQVIQEIMIKELGPGIVRDIDPVPVGSASLAQVHKAVHCETGEVVAVKVQKPNVTFQAVWDLRMYRSIVRMLEWTFDIPLVWSVDFTCSHFMSELDFRKEGRNSDLAKDQLSVLGDTVYVPRVLESSQKVLVTEWIADTVKISDAPTLHAQNFDCKQIILDATKIFGYQIFNTGHVHCDPHSGNLLVRRTPAGSTGRKDNGAGAKSSSFAKHQIVLIDHGLYVDLPHALRKQYARLWVAMAPPADQTAITEICDSWGIGSPELFQSIVKASRDGNKNKAENGENHSEKLKKLTPTERSVLVKQHLKKLLQDTSKFPKELILVGRCMNYIRAANWTHGSPIDRVAVLVNCARQSLREDTPTSKNWLIAITNAVLSYWPTSASYHKEVASK